MKTTLSALFSFFCLLIFSQDKVTSSFGNYIPPYELRTDKFIYDSYYIDTEDGEKLAADVFLPKDYKEGEKLPTIIYLTRYIRMIEGKWFIKILKNPIFGQVAEDEVKYWLEHGYAVSLIDVRGTGASTGVRKMEFSPEEIKDGATVVDWIINQPWSNEIVGVTGISYLGTTAEMLLINQHPNVKACIPRSNIVDLYDHITYPGGLRHSVFIKIWRDLTLGLDVGDFSHAGKQAKMLVKGAQPVQSDKGRKIFKQAQEQHTQNFDIFNALFEIDFKDEVHSMFNYPITAASIVNYLDEIEASGTPIYRIDGWWDGALVKSAIYGYNSTSNSKKMMIGPWDHGPAFNISPFAPDNEVTFPIKTEMLRFFDYYLKGIDNGVLDEKPIHYYTMGDEEWKSTDVWPPQEVAYDTLFFSTDNTLKSRATRQAGEVDYKVDYTVGTGDAAGWNSMTGTYRLGGDISYPDRSEVNKKMQLFTSAPLANETEITGHPIIDLHMSIPTTDGAVYVYLEEVSPEGYVQYITEGQLRFIHRKESDDKDLPTIGPYHSFKVEDGELVSPNEEFQVSFELIPTSYKVPKGHRLQVSIAGSDVNHFALTDIKPSEMTFYYDINGWSALYFPVFK